MRKKETKLQILKRINDVSSLTGDTVDDSKIRALPKSMGGWRVSYFAFPDLKRRPAERYLTFDMAQSVITKFYPVTMDDLKSRSRKRYHVIPRQLICYFMCLYGHTTLSSIGKKMDRDHATVLHGKKTISNLMESDRRFCRKVAIIEAEIILKINLHLDSQAV